MAKSAVAIVFESTGQWAAELRRELPPGFSLAETRSVVETYNGLSNSPATLVAIELTQDNVQVVIDALVHISRSFPAAACIVLTQRTLSPWEDIIRQAGAVHFVDTPRHSYEIGQIARRWLDGARRLQTAIEYAQSSFEEEVAALAPWR